MKALHTDQDSYYKTWEISVGRGVEKPKPLRVAVRNVK